MHPRPFSSPQPVASQISLRPSAARRPHHLQQKERSVSRSSRDLPPQVPSESSKMERTKTESTLNLPATVASKRKEFPPKNPLPMQPRRPPEAAPPRVPEQNDPE